MSIKNNILNDILAKANSGRIKESLNLLQAQQVYTESDFLCLLDSKFLKILFDYFITQMKSSAFKFLDTDISLAQITLSIVHNILETNYQQVSKALIQSNIRDFLCVLASQYQTSESSFKIFSLAAIKIPEIFSKSTFLKLQRFLIEKCTQPALRLEHFLRIFYNLSKHQQNNLIDSYYYVNFLRLQYSQSQKQRMTRESVLMIIDTFIDLLSYEHIKEEISSQIFCFISEYFYPRICMEYHIMSAPDTSNNCSDEQIQIKMLMLLNSFASFDYIPLIPFISKNIEDLKFLLSYKRREQVIIQTISLFIHAFEQKDTPYGEQIIKALLKWEHFSQSINSLVLVIQKKTQALNKCLIEKVYDFLSALMDSDQESTADYFINEFLIGDMADMCSSLDRKRRFKGAQLIMKVLTYIDKLPVDKFINEDDSMIQQGYSEQEVEDTLKQKIILSSVTDVIEIGLQQYNRFGVSQNINNKILALSHKIKLKMQKQFGCKFPLSLFSAQKKENKSIGTNSKAKANQNNLQEDEWEDIDENETDEKQGSNDTNMRINEFEQIIKNFFQ